jgi:hypothetical protein
VTYVVYWNLKNSRCLSATLGYGEQSYVQNIALPPLMPDGCTRAPSFSNDSKFGLSDLFQANEAKSPNSVLLRPLFPFPAKLRSIFRFRLKNRLASTCAGPTRQEGETEDCPALEHGCGGEPNSGMIAIPALGEKQGPSSCAMYAPPLHSV